MEKFLHNLVGCCKQRVHKTVDYSPHQTTIVLPKVPAAASGLLIEHPGCEQWKCHLSISYFLANSYEKVTDI